MTSVLFLGGSGQISAACVPRALEQGMDVTVLNRGTTTLRELPDGVEVLHADLRQPQTVRDVLGGREFDVVAEFLAFTPEHVRTDIDLFEGRTGQYVFISSASAYEVPPTRLPVTESTPLVNPFWEYSRRKAASEEALMTAHAEHGFPVTVVRPSATYDRTRIPSPGGWTDAERMRSGQNVLVVGDGTTAWTVTHSRDFAVGFVGLLGRTDAVGESFHITSDFAPTWNEIYATLGSILEVEPLLVHVPAEDFAAVDEEFGASLLGDKAHPRVFDNTKIKTFVPEFEATTTPEEGFSESIEWRLADPSRLGADPRVTDIFERVLARLPRL